MRYIMACLLFVSTGYAGIDDLNIPDSERTVIDAAIERNKVPKKLIPIVFAIRKAENGDWNKGLAFGVLHPKANKSPEDQAGWACAIIVKRYSEWEAMSSRDMHFIAYTAQSWAPIGVSNDPNGLNKNWVSNVTHYYTIARQ